MSSITVENLRKIWFASQERFDPRTWLLWVVINVIFTILMRTGEMIIVALLIQLTFTVRILSVKRVMALAMGLSIPTVILVLLNVFFFNLNLATVLVLTVKFWLIILLFSWFYAKVDPDDFLMVLESLKIPSVIAWQFSVAYRQIPFMFRKYRNLHDILVSRGVPLDCGVIRAARMLPSFLVPLLVQVQEDAEQLSEAMICRGWHPGIRGSRVFGLKFKKKDVVLMLVMVSYAITLIIVDFLLNIPA